METYQTQLMFKHFCWHLGFFPLAQKLTFSSENQPKPSLSCNQARLSTSPDRELQWGVDRVGLLPPPALPCTFPRTEACEYWNTWIILLSWVFLWLALVSQSTRFEPKAKTSYSILARLLDLRLLHLRREDAIKLLSCSAHLRTENTGEYPCIRSSQERRKQESSSTSSPGWVCFYWGKWENRTWNKIWIKNTTDVRYKDIIKECLIFQSAVELAKRRDMVQWARWWWLD